MKDFADLYERIDRTTSTAAKVEALVAYFRSAPAADAAWAVSFLVGRRPKRLVKTPELRRWAAELAEGRAYRLAVNQDMADLETALKDGDEVAVFPPVTGG